MIDTSYLLYDVPTRIHFKFNFCTTPNSLKNIRTMFEQEKLIKLTQLTMSISKH